jgi:HD-GYP domain-containing protein (c-di-GMP phosphodiesterase class II)
VHISTLLALLIVITGGLIGWFNYHQTSKVVLTAADRVFDELYLKLYEDLEYRARLSHATMDMLASASVTQAGDLETRLESLSLFADALEANGRFSSLYVGYDDGEFFQVVVIRGAAQRQYYSAPDAAAYVVWSVETAETGDIVSNYHYFDEALAPVAPARGEGRPYDPRSRPWYVGPGTGRALTITPPYVFFAQEQVGTTLSRRSAAGASVVAGDSTLDRLSAILAGHAVSPSVQVAIFDDQRRLIAYPDAEQVVQRTADGTPTGLTSMDDMDNPVLARMLEGDIGERRRTDFREGGRLWKSTVRRLPVNDQIHVNLALAAPEDELIAEAVTIRWQSLGMTGLLILAALPFGWLTSKLLSTPLTRLAGESRAIQQFDFSQRIQSHSVVREIDQLSQAMDSAKQTIRNFIDLSADLAAEHRFDTLLGRVLEESMGAVDADLGLLHLLSEDETEFEPAAARLRGDRAPVDTESLPATPFEPANGGNALSEAARRKTRLGLRLDEAGDSGLDAITRRVAGAREHKPLACQVVPLRTARDEVVGTLTLAHRADRSDLEEMTGNQRMAFVEALAGVAAVALDNQSLFKAQKDLLNALIKLIAGAIDAKSPYTGGHCQRVPELTRMLAEAANESHEPPFSDFELTDEDWEAIDIASWLHDCGKVITPEYVVDKATKLETLYNRLHEVRMRFEVLKRDADLAYWQGLADGGDRGALARERDGLQRTLDEEFAFVAACNVGGEAMSDEDLTRLESVGARTWRRTLDDRIGLSWEETQRAERTPARPLPVEERLLEDKLEHVIERPTSERIPDDNPWGFRLTVPERKYDRGELHNLGVARGTLTEEERYVINEHIVRTIMMLEQLPLPKHLRQVPEIAGGHHETLDGKGYPRRLRRDDMSLPARMMAIADIFEALTAADRPYKRGKTLSEAIGIMASMRDRHHIDPDLFALFLRTGIYRRYAERFLDAGQIDAVDVDAYVTG